MDPRRSGWIGLVAFASMLATSCVPETPVDRLDPPRSVLDAVGVRLSKTHREAEITRLAHDPAALLAALTAEERSALGRDWVRFRVDRPCVVEVAVADPSPPFWLRDRGFALTPREIRRPEGAYRIYEAPVAAGWVGLGVDRLDAPSRTPYFALVRASEGGSRPVVAELSGETARASTVDDAGGPYHDAPGSSAPWPEWARGSTLIRTRRAGARECALLQGRAWKSRSPSSGRPDQVALAFGEDASRSLAISWRTDARPSASVVRIRRAGDVGGMSTRSISGSSELVRSDGLMNDPVIRRHKVRIDDLAPDAAFEYAIGPDSADWRPVRTAPAPGDRGDLQFLAMGDPQCGLEQWGALLKSARDRHPDAAFLMIAGDLVDRGNERTNWDHFFLRAAPVFDGLPMMPAVGNHEYLDEGPRLYRANFATPEGGPPAPESGLAYSFRAGDLLVVVLDSESAIHDDRSAARQAAWLDARLAGSTATWTIVTFHHPIYPSHASRPVAPILKSAWLPVIDRHGVDLVLNGHDHAYLRTPPMVGDRPATGPGRGTIYSVSVSGTKFSPSTRRDYAAAYLVETPTYQVIDVSGSSRTLTYRAIDRSGREVDRFVLGARRSTVPRSDAE